MEDDLLKYLYDSKEAAAAILRFVRDKTVDDYARDELLRSGVERKFEMIGEALNRVSRDNPTVRDKIREHRHIVCSGLSSHTATTALRTGLCGASLKKTWANSSKM
jgi:Ribonuclease HepT-like